MKSITYFVVAACLAAPLVSALPKKSHDSTATSTASVTAAVATATGAISASGLVRGAQTIVLFEVGGVSGNECMTFRNNGEMVDAACVDTSADRQITPSTLNGQNVLLVQRTFTADFRSDLVDVDACVGFNGTDFKAEPCTSSGITLVTYTGGSSGEMRAGTVCASGHNSAAELTIDQTGTTCATYTSTSTTASNT